MEFEHIRFQTDDRVATITLNRPEKLNAFTPTMRGELLEAFDRVDEDDNVRVLIVTGAGKAFCAGADLSGGGGKSFQAESTESINDWRDGGGRIALRLFEMKKPVIAAINGSAVGIGATMTLPMDIRIASQDAKFGFVFTRRAIAPDGCCTWFLPRIVGIGVATEWFMTGKVFPAQEAFEAGLISRIVAQEQLMPTVTRIAREIAEQTSAVSVALARQMLWNMLTADHPIEAHKIESKCLYFLSRSEDCKEGVNAFLEKRLPRFMMRPSIDMPDFYPWWEQRKFR